ncbi:ABC transporter substrate-binding protein [Actinoplanes sp. N902-109]|uniref:ABC transporter substrate-binding protein n=1 Tax=Actinoplanes sp. (strain N902-109) TaxID=649831 RepID=UPI000329552E|nr:extracellular solute-binding protein [Actinoplanes sp. N902-109]AGL14321.1 sugar ABC transporter substrate-binding protein [Actinoplanes sp. N902-109]
MRIRKASIAALAVLTLGLTACGSGDDADSGSGKITGKVTLQTWALTPKFTGYLNEVIAGFKAKYPGTDVQLLDQPGDGYADKVLSQAASNSLPDVVNLPPDFALPLAQQDLLADVSKGGLDLSSTYVPGSIDAYKFNGLDGVYGYPWYLNTDLNYWNKTKFAKCGLDANQPPATTQELFTQAATMHTRCPDEYLMSRKPTIVDFTLAGIPIVSDDGKKFVFNTDQAAALVDQYRDAFKAGLMPPTVLNSDYLGNSKLFTQGKVAWSTGGATSLKDFTTDNPSLKGNVAVSKALDTPPLYVQGLSVSKKSKNLATARALAEWVTDADNQNKFGHLVNVFPSTSASASDPYFAKDDGTDIGKARALAFEELKTAKNLQPYEVNQAMQTYLDQQIALAVKGDETSKKALDDAVAKLNTMLARQ